MAIVKHLKVTALGRINGSPERFSYGINFHMDQGPDEWTLLGENTNGTNWWADVAEDFRLFHGRNDTNLHPDAVLESVKLAVIVPDAEGKPKYQTINGTRNTREVRVTDTPGGSTVGAGIGQYILPQSALAVTLQSDRSGPSGRGRFYLPMPVLALASDKRVLASHVDYVKSSVAQLFTDIANEPFIDLGPAVLAPTVASSKGFNSPVTSIKVGRVIDTIRSRRNALQEGYVFTPVTQ